MPEPSLRPARPRRRGAATGASAVPEQAPDASIDQQAVEEITRHVAELHDVVWAIVDSLAEIRELIETRSDQVLARLERLEKLVPPAVPAKKPPAKNPAPPAQKPAAKRARKTPG